MPTPLVSVITTTYNGDRFLAQTIESVLTQTFDDFEYLIVDDVSTDCSLQIINGYASRDSRIRVVKNGTRLGPAGALNRALQAARGDFIANLDHDDLAMPKRLAAQTAFLEGEPSVGVIGSYVRGIDGDGCETSAICYPVEPQLIRWGLLFRGCVAHSAAMMRRDLIRQVRGYSLHHPYACDYELWTRLVHLTDLANIPEFLAAYRSTDGQTSRTKWKSQQGQVFLLIYAAIHRLLGVRVSLRGVHNLFRATREASLITADEIVEVAELLETILRLYLEQEQPDAATETAIRADCALKMCQLARYHRECLPTWYDWLLNKALVMDPLLVNNLNEQSISSGNY